MFVQRECGYVTSIAVDSQTPVALHGVRVVEKTFWAAARDGMPVEANVELVAGFVGDHLAVRVGPSADARGLPGVAQTFSGVNLIRLRNNSLAAVNVQRPIALLDGGVVEQIHRTTEYHGRAVGTDVELVAVFVRYEDAVGTGRRADGGGLARIAVASSIGVVITVVATVIVIAAIVVRDWSLPTLNIFRPVANFGMRVVKKVFRACDGYWATE